MADCPGGSLLWLACLLRRSLGVAWGGGSMVLAVHPRGAAETFGREEKHAEGGCVARSNRAGEGGEKTRFSFSG